MKLQLKPGDYINGLISLDGAFNPSIIDKTWMKENQLLGKTEAEKLRNSVFSNQYSRFESLFYEFQCTSEKIEVYYSDLETSNISDTFLKSILSLLNHTKVSRAKVTINCHLSYTIKAVSHLFESFNCGPADADLRIDEMEDIHYWSNEKQIRLGRCPSSEDKIHLQVLKIVNFEGQRTAAQAVDYLEANVDFRNEAIKYITKIHKILSTHA